MSRWVLAHWVLQYDTHNKKCFQVDGVKIYGSPHVPGIGREWAFFYKREEAGKVRAPFILTLRILFKLIL